MSRPCEIGVLLPTREAVMSGRFDTAPLLAMAERVETLGYDSVWVGDSLLARPRFEPLTLLAAVAARTRRIRLGTAVLLPALRHPLLLAHAVATLDRLAEGRLVLGVGVAPDTPAVRQEFGAAGVLFSQRVGRLVDTIRLCRRLWAAGADGVTVEGRYWRLDHVGLLPTPHRLGGPPIWMGGEVDAATRRAGSLADGWVPNSVTAEAWAEGWSGVQAAAAAEGRDGGAIVPALYTTIHVDPDPETAHLAMRRFVEGYYNAPYETIARRQGFHAGDAGSCAERLNGFIRAGARHIVLRLGGGDQGEQLARLTQDVLPRLAG